MMMILLCGDMIVLCGSLVFVIECELSHHGHTSTTRFIVIILYVLLLYETNDVTSTVEFGRYHTHVSYSTSTYIIQYHTSYSIIPLVRMGKQCFQNNKPSFSQKYCTASTVIALFCTAVLQCILVCVSVWNVVHHTLCREFASGLQIATCNGIFQWGSF